MKLQLNTLSSNLNNITKNIDFTDAANQAQSALDKFNATQKSVFGGVVGEIKGGVESLTQEIDNAQDALNANLTAAVVRITSDIDGASADLVGVVPSEMIGDITALTGKAEAAANGFLKEITSASSPKAVASAISSVTGRSAAEINNTLKAITLPTLQDVVTKAVDISPYADLFKSLSVVSTQFDHLINSGSAFSLVDLGEKITKNYNTNVNQLVDRNVTLGDVADTFKLVAEGDHDAAFKIISNYIDKPDNYDFIIKNTLPSSWSSEVKATSTRIADIEAGFKVLDVSLTSYVEQYSASTNGAGQNTIPVRGPNDEPSTGAYGKDTKGDAWNFNDITSLDELESLFRNINRTKGKEITGCTVHWSATFLDQDVDSNWLNNVHQDKGYSGVGYHIIIRRDGTLQRGRPMNRTGAHDYSNNTNFLGFCFIGGINSTIKNARKPYWKYASSDSFSLAQWKAYDGLMNTFHKVFPYAQVAGHYMTSTEGKIDPGFDVPGYSLAKFAHSNVVDQNDNLWRAGNAITLDLIQRV